MGSDNINWIKNELVPNLVEDCKLTIPDCISVPVIKTLDVKKLTSSESFMLTNCYKIHVVLSDPLNESILKEFRLVAKITPQLPQQLYNSIHFGNLFKNEIVAYTEVFDLLGWSDFYPKYYYSHIKENEAAIVLSDFSVDNWVMAKSLFNLSFEHILVAARELGKFHGDSYALKERDPQKFLAIMNRFEEARFKGDSFEGDWELVTRTGPKRAFKAVRESGKNKVPEWFLKELEVVLSDPYKILKQTAQPVEPYAILCHGDYLRNNIAFKYLTDEKDNEIPVQAMMFDFQTLRYSSPMLDFALLLSNSAGRDVRQPHFTQIFTEYHKTLIECYSNSMKSKIIPEFLSYDALMREYTKHTLYSFIIAASFLKELHAPLDGSILNRGLSAEEIIQETYTQGGKSVDRELESLVEEIYKFHVEYKVDLKLYMN